jgi:hypothetical protein
LREQFGNDTEQYEKAHAAFLNQPIPLSLVCKWIRLFDSKLKLKKLKFGSD